MREVCNVRLHCAQSYINVLLSININTVLKRNLEESMKDELNGFVNQAHFIISTNRTLREKEGENKASK